MQCISVLFSSVLRIVRAIDIEDGVEQLFMISCKILQMCQGIELLKKVSDFKYTADTFT
jgi:hypothetical protein